MLFFQSTSSKLAVSMFSFSCLVLSMAASIYILAFFLSTCSSSRANLAFNISFSDLNWSISLALAWLRPFFLPSQLIEKEFSFFEVSFRAADLADSSSTLNCAQMSFSSPKSCPRLLTGSASGQWYFCSLTMQVRMRYRLLDLEGCCLLVLAADDLFFRVCRSCEESTSTQQEISRCSSALSSSDQNSSKSRGWPVLVVTYMMASEEKTPSHSTSPNFSVRKTRISPSTVRRMLQSLRRLLSANDFYIFILWLFAKYNAQAKEGNK